MLNTQKPDATNSLHLYDANEEGLTPEQLSHFHNILKCQKSELQAQLLAIDIGESELAPDPNDRASQETDRNMVANAIERFGQRLTDVNAAIKRLEAGEYGYCEDTGDFIGLGRLLANPTARYTIEAQTQRETRQKQIGRH